jgi:hypothetical protein
VGGNRDRPHARARSADHAAKRIPVDIIPRKPHAQSLSQQLPCARFTRCAESWSPAPRPSTAT